MRRQLRRPRPRLGRPRTVVSLAAAAAVATLVVLGAPGRADAHAELLSTEPAAGAQLDTAPAEIVLRFTEAVSLTEDSLEVLDADGERLDVGEAGHPGGERSAVAASLPEVADGAYVVAWRVVSSDSHPVAGAFTFRVGDAGGAPADDQALIDEVLGGSRDGDRTLGAVYGVVRFLAFGGVVVLVGAAVALAWIWPDGRDDSRARRIMAGAWWLAVAATVLSIPVQGAYAAGGTLGDVVSADVIADELGTRSGRAWVARLMILAAVAVAAPALRRADAATARAASVAGGLAMLVTVSLTGHATSGDLVPLAFVTDVVHLSGVSVWLGGLAIVLFAVVRRAEPGDTGDTGDPGDAVAGDARETGVGDGGASGPGAAAGVVARFSSIAFGAVMIIVASGTLQGWRQVGGYDALFDTTYGRLLVTKVLLVATMLVAAGYSRAWVRQRTVARLGRPAALSPGPGAKASPDLGTLRRSVGAEVGLAVAVLAVTALLVNAVPGGAGDTDGSATSGGGGPFSAQLTEDDIVLTLDVDPATVGPVAIHLFLNEPDGTPVQPEEVTATLELPERDLGPLDVTLVDFGQGHYSADGAEIPLAGDWQLEVVARTSDIDQTVFETDVPVQ